MSMDGQYFLLLNLLLSQQLCLELEHVPNPTPTLRITQIRYNDGTGRPINYVGV
jgi:hypothetical protein